MTPLLWFFAYLIFGFCGASLFIRNSDFLHTQGQDNWLVFFFLWLLWPSALLVGLAAFVVAIVEIALKRWIKFLVRR